MRIWSIEGNDQRLDGGAMFGNVPKNLWSQWMPPDEQNRIDLACRGLLVDDLNDRLVLFEAGVGAFFEPKLKERFGVVQDAHVLLDSLQRAGFDHADIDAVVLSHLHFDHAGGLLKAWHVDAPPELVFPNACYLVSAAAWDRARNPHPRDRASFIPELPGLLESSGRLEIVTGDHSPTLGDAVRFSYSEGHTPGLMLSEIGGNGGVAFCADLVPARPWVHLPVTMGFDRFPERLIDEKRAFLEDKIARGIRLFFTHDPGCAMALPTVDDRGRFSTTAEVTRLEGLPL